MKFNPKIALISSIFLLSAQGVAASDYRIMFQSGVEMIGDSHGDFESHTFTNCGKTGRTGPSLTNCLSEYENDWVQNNEQFSVNSGIQQWTVKSAGEYRITAAGAEGGGRYGGDGAIMSGTFTLSAGETVQILVGQQGSPQTSYNGSGTNNASGGGGTFVILQDNTPLVVAGGGGAAYSSNSPSQKHANINKSGSSSTGDVNSFSGGSGGSGGGGNTTYAGGAGFSGDGSRDASSFLSGGFGGSDYNNGGFGGGGETSDNGSFSRLGGGGGYSGGAGSRDNSSGYVHSAGGGGSYNDGASQENNVGNRDHGYVLIEPVN